MDYFGCCRYDLFNLFRHLWFEEPDSTLREVTFCLYNEKDFGVFAKAALSYLEHIVQKVQTGPFTTVDVIIEIGHGIVLIERSNPPFGWALPGGFVEVGESLEDCVKREAEEETGLKIHSLKQFHTYSEPNRDPRFHTISTVFTAKAQGQPKSGSDAASLKVVNIDDLLKINYAFDHRNIIEDYLKYIKK